MTLRERYNKPGIILIFYDVVKKVKQNRYLRLLIENSTCDWSMRIIEKPVLLVVVSKRQDTLLW